jgi:transcriptional regulator with XRE-family HTH domain
MSNGKTTTTGRVLVTEDYPSQPAKERNSTGKLPKNPSRNLDRMYRGPREEMKKAGRAIRERREALGLSCSEIAARTFISTTYVQKTETGEWDAVSKPYLVLIALALDLKPSDIMPELGRANDLSKVKTVKVNAPAPAETIVTSPAQIGEVPEFLADVPTGDLLAELGARYGKLMADNDDLQSKNDKLKGKISKIADFFNTD